MEEFLRIEIHFVLLCLISLPPLDSVPLIVVFTFLSQQFDRQMIDILGDACFQHQESVMSSLSLAEHKHQKPVNGRKKNNRLNSSTWHTSSFDLSKTLIKNDYFSDINPRSMRRLMNIVAVTGNSCHLPFSDVTILFVI